MAMPPTCGLRTVDPAVIGRRTGRARHRFRSLAHPARRCHAAHAHTQILAYHDERVGELNADGRYKHIDVARLHPDDGRPALWSDTARAAREKFLSEHSARRG